MAADDQEGLRPVYVSLRSARVQGNGNDWVLPGGRVDDGAEFDEEDGLDPMIYIGNLRLLKHASPEDK